MNKTELIEALARYYDGDKTEAAKALNAVLETITYQTAAQGRVTLTGFGTFEKLDRPPRVVQNPHTGRDTKVKRSAVPRFRPGADLRAYVAGEKKVPRAAAKKPAPARKAATAAPEQAPPRRPTAGRRPAKAVVQRSDDDANSAD